MEHFCARWKRAYSSKEDTRSSFLFRLLVVQQPENLPDTKCWDSYLYSDSGNTAALSGFLVFQLTILTISFPSGTPLFQWVLWFSWSFWEIFILCYLILSLLKVKTYFPDGCCRGWGLRLHCIRGSARVQRQQPLPLRIPSLKLQPKRQSAGEKQSEWAEE